LPLSLLDVVATMIFVSSPAALNAGLRLPAHEGSELRVAPLSCGAIVALRAAVPVKSCRNGVPCRNVNARLRAEVSALNLRDAMHLFFEWRVGRNTSVWKYSCVSNIARLVRMLHMDLAGRSANCGIRPKGLPMSTLRTGLSFIMASALAASACGGEDSLTGEGTGGTGVTEVGGSAGSAAKGSGGTSVGGTSAGTGGSTGGSVTGTGGSSATGGDEPGAAGRPGLGIAGDRGFGMGGREAGLGGRPGIGLGMGGREGAVFGMGGREAGLGGREGAVFGMGGREGRGEAGREGAVFGMGGREAGVGGREGRGEGGREGTVFGMGGRAERGMGGRAARGMGGRGEGGRGGA
jgi:hypothetical protein